MFNTGLEGTRSKYDTSVFRREELDNGIPVWMQESPILPDHDGTLILFLPAVGSQMDPPDSPGTAHFFEHIPFRLLRGNSQDELVISAISEEGGRVQGQTSKIWTRYIIDVHGDYLDLAAKVIHDIVFNPPLDKDNVSREIGTIVQEYRSLSGKGENIRNTIIGKLFWGDHPRTHDVIGTIESIQAMTAERLTSFHQTYYSTANIHLICGGTFPQNQNALSVLNAHFGKIPIGEKAMPNAGFSFGQPQNYVVEEPACRRDSLYLWYPLPPQPDTQDMALRLLSSAMSANLDSPLVVELRRKRGLTYESGMCDVASWSEVVAFSLNLFTPHKNFSEVKEVFYQVLSEVNVDLLAKFQKRRQLGRRGASQHPHRGCLNAVTDVTLWGRIYSDHEVERIKDQVSPEEVLYWRDYLLSAEPWSCEIIATK